MRPSAAAQLGLSLGERFGRPFAIARAAPPRDQKQSSGLWLPHCCDWAIAQVRGPRQRAAADYCFQRWWLQPNRRAASDLAVPAARAKEGACAQRRTSETSQEQVCPVRGFDGSAVLITARNARRVSEHHGEILGTKALAHASPRCAGARRGAGTVRLSS